MIGNGLKLALLLATLWVVPAFAQDEEAECTRAGTEITNLREPQFGVAGNVWDLLDGGDGMDVFSDIIPMENNTTIVGGSFTKDKDGNIYHPLLIKFDDRFKKIWEVRNDKTAYKTIHRVLKTKAGFTVLGDVQEKGRGNGIYLGFYTADGKPKGEVPFFEKGGNLDAKALVLAADATGYLMAAQFTNGKDEDNQFGILYKVTPAGKPIWKRSYKPGPTTVFQNLQSTLDGAYMASGQIITEDNKSGGWLMRLDNKGAIVWQRTYPRGLAATFLSATQMQDQSLIVTGKIRPLSGADVGLSAWIMKTDSTGNMLWQRYFKSPFYDYAAADSIVYEDGRASVLITGAGLDSEHRSHARLVTLSPLGLVHSLEDFTDGQNATANRLVTGLEGERLMAGYAQTSFGDGPENSEAAPSYTYDGWIVAGVPLELYEDPCDIPRQSSPILP